jgi:hypothetical protein
MACLFLFSILEKEPGVLHMLGKYLAQYTPRLAHRVFFFLIVFILFYFILFYVYKCFAYMYICARRTCLMPMESRRGPESPKTGVTDGYELPRGGWELNLGPLKEHPVLLISEPFLQLPNG